MFQSELVAIGNHNLSLISLFAGVFEWLVEGSRVSILVLHFLGCFQVFDFCVIKVICSIEQ